MTQLSAHEASAPGKTYLFMNKPLVTFPRGQKTRVPSEKEKGGGRERGVPDEVLVLPRGTNAGDLEDEDAVVVEEVVDVAQERVVPPDADVLGHLERDNLGKLFRLVEVPKVGAEDPGAGRVDAVLGDPVRAELGLVVRQGDAGRVAAKVFRGVRDEGAPPAANVEQRVFGLEAQFLAHDGEFVVLELFERLLLVGVADDARGVDHARAEEPLVKVVAAVIVVGDLLLVLAGRVEDDIGDQVLEDVLHELHGHDKGGPVVAPLEQLEHVTCADERSATQRLEVPRSEGNGPLMSIFPSK